MPTCQHGHSHQHDHDQHHGHSHAAHSHGHHHHGDGLSFAFWLNLLFSIVEIIGGLVTNSTAIIADAFHDFMDAFAIGMAVVFEKISKKKRSSQFSFGYRRFSLVSALVLSVFLLSGSAIMLVSGLHTIIRPEPVHSLGMLALAALGIAVNGLAAFKLSRGSGQSSNHKAVMLHLLEDILGWLAVLLGALIIYFTHWYWIDGVLAVAIASFIAYNASRILFSTMKILLQSVPEHLDIEELQQALSAIDGVQSIHDLHIWSLDGNYHIGSAHAVIDKSVDPAAVHQVILAIMQQFQIEHSTIQIETSDKTCTLCDC